jgi:hypothetical protein
MVHRNGHDKETVPSNVHKRKALGISLLLRVRSGAGVVVVVADFGTGFRLAIPGALFLTGVSMLTAVGAHRERGEGFLKVVGDLGVHGGWLGSALEMLRVWCLHYVTGRGSLWTQGAFDLGPICLWQNRAVRHSSG